MIPDILLALNLHWAAWLSTSDFRKEEIHQGDGRTVLLLIAVLIATATYQAGLSFPGNVWQDNSDSSNKNDTKKTKSHTAGKSILGTNDRIAFGIFLFSNSTGFYMSLFIIDILTRGFPLRIELQICILAMVFTYNISMANLSAGGLTISFHAFSLFCPLAIPIILTWVRLLLDKRRRRVQYQCLTMKLNQISADEKELLATAQLNK